MAVQFVVGRSGSGKTHRTIQAITASLRAQPLGPNIFWILPRQATFSAERELTCNSGISGFFRARVFSFEQLGHEIIRSQGGESIPMITALGRKMIIGHLLRTHASKLKYFGAVALQPGLADKLDATFSDFEASGKTSVDLMAFEKVLRGEQLSLHEHLSLDDSDVFFHIKQWRSSDDRTLAAFGVRATRSTPEVSRSMRWAICIGSSG